MSDARPPHWRFNFLVLGGDVAFFSLALNISSAQAILPLYVHAFVPGNEAVAAIAAVRALGVYAPQLFVAPIAERLRHAKPFILAATVFERVPYLVMALATLWLARGPALLAIFYVMLLVALLAGGVTFPAWLDLIARTIPYDWRGRFLGWWQALGGLLGIGGASIATALIVALKWPYDFSAIFASTFGFMIVSFVLLSLGREPARFETPTADSPSSPPPAARKPLLVAAREQTRSVLALLRADEGLRWLLAANAAMGIATMAGSLFAVSALRPGGLSDAQVGAQSIVLAVAVTVGYIVWGWLGDRVGHRAVLIGAVACLCASAAVALAARGVVAYSTVFFLLGAGQAATFVGFWTFIAEMAPAPRRPTYIAISAVGYAPFAVGAPILGGLLADQWGYSIVFGLSAAAALVAIALFAWRVPEPRHHAPSELPAGV